MKRYLLSFFAAYALACGASFAMLLAGLVNWFFGPTPVGFDILSALTVLMVFCGVGIFSGWRAKKKGAATPRWGALFCVAALAVLGFLESIGVEEMLSLVGMSGVTVGNAVVSAFDLTYRWGYQTYQKMVWPAVGTLSAAAQGVIFHLGWTLGRKE